MGCIVSNRDKFTTSRPKLLTYLSRVRDEKQLTNKVNEPIVVKTDIKPKDSEKQKFPKAENDFIKNAFIDFISTDPKSDGLILQHNNAVVPAPSEINTNLNKSYFQKEQSFHKLQYISNTKVTFEWLLQRLIEKFKCPEEPEPQWIVEKMNVTGGKGMYKIIFN